MTGTVWDRGVLMIWGVYLYYMYHYSTTFNTQSHRRPIHTPHRQLVAPTLWKQKFGRKGGVWRPELGARCIGLRDAQGQ